MNIDFMGLPTFATLRRVVAFLYHRVQEHFNRVTLAF